MRVTSTQHKALCTYPIVLLEQVVGLPEVLRGQLAAAQQAPHGPAGDVQRALVLEAVLLGQVVVLQRL
jgi:ABC-type tungstate transport system substrate-binding protein